MVEDQSLSEIWNSECLDSARRQLAARDDAIVRAQVAISEIAAPTGEESERGAWVAERLSAVGLCDVRAT